MSAALLIGMTDTVLNGHRPTQIAGLGGAFAAALIVNPAIGLVAGMAALGIARMIGRNDGQEINAFDAVVSAHRPEQKAVEPADSQKTYHSWGAAGQKIRNDREP